MEAKHLLLVQVATALPYFAIQVRVIYVLAQNKGNTFGQPFFRLLLFNNITYTVLWLLIHIFQYNYPLYYGFFIGPPPNPDVYVHWKGVIYYLISCFGFTTFICSFFLSLNRLSSIALPFKHKKIWSRLLPFTYPISITIPLLAFLGQSFAEAKHVLDENPYVNYYYFDIRNQLTSWSKDRIFVVTFELSIVVLCLSTNISSTVYVYSSGHLETLRQMGAFSANFIVICMFDLFVHIIWLMYDVTSYLNEFHDFSRLYYWSQFFYILADNFNLLLPGTFLALTNRVIRQAAFSGLLRWRRTSQQSTTATVTISAAPPPPFSPRLLIVPQG